MLKYINEDFQIMFDHNFNDWCSGGPKANGWTRTGELIIPNYLAKIVSYTRTIISVNEVLAKNLSEVERWHLDFLTNPRNKIDSQYWKEYLIPRCSRLSANDKCINFLNLFDSIKKNGYRFDKPVFVADISGLNFGFKFFRFDGCHRACCARILGIENIPAYVFRLELK